MKSMESTMSQHINRCLVVIISNQFSYSAACRLLSFRASICQSASILAHVDEMECLPCC